MPAFSCNQDHTFCAGDEGCCGGTSGQLDQDAGGRKQHCTSMGGHVPTDVPSRSSGTHPSLPLFEQQCLQSMPELIDVFFIEAFAKTLNTIAFIAKKYKKHI